MQEAKALEEENAAAQAGGAGGGTLSLQIKPEQWNKLKGAAAFPIHYRSVPQPSENGVEYLTHLIDQPFIGR
jgi:hypothetical protein